MGWEMEAAKVQVQGHEHGQPRTPVSCAQTHAHRSVGVQTMAYSQGLRVLWAHKQLKR